MKKQTLKELAKEFSMVINDWFTPAELEEVNKRNEIYAEAGEPEICATHEFYDSNEAMCQAFNKVFNRDAMSKAGDNAFMNAAWTIAKRNNFLI